MKKIIYLLIFVPFLMWGQDTYTTVTSASGKNVNKKTQLAVNVVVDTVDFSGELQNKGVENLQDALNSIDAFILAASDPFDPDADLLSNDALWDFKRLNQDFFKLDPANNRIQAMGDFKIGGGSNTVLTNFRAGISSTSSAKGGLGITQTAGNTNPFIAWGNNSAGNDLGQINSDGSITAPSFIGDGSQLTGVGVPEGYISPRSYGAIMDGVTDDRTAFVATLAAAESLGKKIWIDSDMFLDVSTTASSIFLPSNIEIKGSNKDVNVVYNNQLSPAFYAVLEENITIKNITFLYDNTFDASYDYRENTDVTDNQTYLKNYIESNKGTTYSSGNPVFRAPSTFYATIFISGSKDINIENVVFKAKKGVTADRFIRYVIKLKEEHESNQGSITESGGNTVIPENITLDNVVFDGYVMGIQGIVKNLVVDNLKAYRYSDIQNADGSNMGAKMPDATYNFPPPHLIYLNTDSSTKGYYPENIKFTNVVDYGDFVGVSTKRDEVSGYIHSLKFVNNIHNLFIDNFKGYRKEGLGDLGGITNGVIKNIYAESTVGIYSPSNNFNSLRFLEVNNNCIFDNVTLKDVSDNGIEIYPMDYMSGSNILMNNIHVYVNELSVTPTGLFGIWGNNNTISNSSLSIDNHTATTTNKGVIFNDPVKTTSFNNNFDVTINGWKKIDSDPLGFKSRMLFATASNPNINYARIIDNNNNLKIEQKNEINTETWTRTEIVDLTSTTGTSVLIDTRISNGWDIVDAKVVVLSALDSGVTAQLINGTSNDFILIDSISNSANSINKSDFDIITDSQTTDSRVYLKTSANNFNSTGSVKVTLTLQRTSLN